MSKKKNINKYGQEQLTLRVPAPNGGMMPLQFKVPRATPEDAIPAMLAESIRLVKQGQNGGKCVCHSISKMKRERHLIKTCQCFCHRKKSKRRRT